jgi:hypothetical protein
MKKKAEEPIVRCSSCIFSGDVINYMTDCINIEANPKGFKMGTYPRKCKYFKEKQQQ